MGVEKKTGFVKAASTAEQTEFIFTYDKPDLPGLIKIFSSLTKNVKKT